MSAYTEEEARTKWCPFARTFDGPIVTHEVAAVASVNRIGTEASIHCLCLASDCMAWRVVLPAAFSERLRVLIKANEKIHAIKAWRAEYDASLIEAKNAIEEIIAGRRPIPGIAEEQGYCGAAAMPR